jgi:DMSO/TMAO reductase YedYZ heme-binding membrane subunit
MYGLPLWVLIIFFLFNPSFEKVAINSTTAFVGLTLAGITFILGPLPRFVKQASRLKIYRRYLGLSSFAFIVVHAAISIIIVYDLDLSFMLSPDNPRMLQVYSAVFAFLIFFLMSVTSSAGAIRMLGPRRWKLLQTSGYIAIALALVHFMFANTRGGMFNIGRTYAELVFIFGLIVIIVRIFVFVLEKTSRKK